MPAMYSGSREIASRHVMLVWRVAGHPAQTKPDTDAAHHEIHHYAGLWGNLVGGGGGSQDGATHMAPACPSGGR